MIKRCCICGSKFYGHGCNAMPIKKGKCCGTCNELVLKERIKRAKESEERC